MTLNGTILLGSADGTVIALLTFSGTQTLSGAGKIIFGGAGNNDLAVSDSTAILTVGPGITIDGKSGTFTGGEIVNEGTIAADGAAGVLGIVASSGFSNSGTLEVNNAETLSLYVNGSNVSLSTTWSNTGTFEVNGGFLNLGGTFTPEDIDTFSRKGGTVNLYGTLNNDSAPGLVLDNSKGSWNLIGQINGGTITTTGNNTLVAAANTFLGYSVLNGITLDGVLDLSSNNAVTVDVTGGLILNGVIDIGAANGSTASYLAFVGTQTLDTAMSGHILFGSSPSNSMVIPPGTTLIVSSGVTIDGQSGLIGPGAAGEITPGGSLAVGGTINAEGASTLILLCSVTVAGSGIITSQPNATISVREDLVGPTLNAYLFSPLGTMRFEGSGTSTAPQLLEAMSQDLGNVSPGFYKNFALGNLVLSNNTYVQLVDNNHNSAGTGPEAVYTGTLVVPSGCTLDLNGLNLYARAAQIQGAVINGSVSLVPGGGPIQFGTPTPADIATAGQIDDWTFFGRAGQSLTVFAGTGAGSLFPPLSPGLGFAQIQLVDPSGNVVATASNSTSGNDATISAALQSDGTYNLYVQAAPGQGSSTGDYVLSLWNATVHNSPLNLNETTYGQLGSPYAIDNWSFTAVADEQVRLDVLGGAVPGFLYDLTGPNGYAAFSNTTTSSTLINLPAAGAYTLTVHAAQPTQGAYSFEMEQTSVTALTSGVTFNGVFAGSGQAQLFTLPMPQDNELLIALGDSNPGDRVEVYAKFGIPPTRADQPIIASGPTSASLNFVIPKAAPGIWYILVYAEGIAAPTQDYSLTATVSSLALTSLTPSRLGNAADALLTLAGAGFDSTTTVSLVAADGTTYPANQVQLDLPTQLTATFTAGSVPPGVYSVVVTNAQGASATISNAFTMDQGGAPSFHANLVPPFRLLYHSPATLYLQYSNTGDLAMPAPLIEVTVSQTHANGVTDQKALLTLDSSLLSEGFTYTTLPPGFSNTIQILASGATPGLLEPGESIQVPIYWAGWEQPWDFSFPNFQPLLNIEDPADTTPIPWSAVLSSMQPSYISAGAWNAMSPIVQSRFGSTWGGFVQRLDSDAQYLASLGEKVTDVDHLWNYEVQLANGLCCASILSSVTDASVPTPGPELSVMRVFRDTINSRYETGPFGQGWEWANDWQRTLTVSNGMVIVTNPDGSQRIFTPNSAGGYSDELGDFGILVAVGGGQYTLQETDGTLTGFGSDGKVAYMQDTNGNKVTAGFTSGLLTSLTASTGQSLDFSYNSAGLITAITDSTGRTTQYTYDATNQFLLSVTDFAGRTTSYTYDTSGTPTTQYALLSITNPDGTVDNFTYDAQGRLAETFETSAMMPGTDMMPITYTYGPVGDVAATDANGGTTRYSFDDLGRIVKVTDALGNATHYLYNDKLELTETIDPIGHVTTYAYDQDGNIIGTTGPNGDTISYSFTDSSNRLSSYTDANGNTTNYNYDSQGNLLSIVYPDSSQQQFTYDPLGNLTESVNRRGQAIHNTYNAMGELTEADFADGTQMTYTYDSHGLLLTATDSTGTTTFLYDPVTEDLLQVSYPGGRYLQFKYNAAGYRIQSIDQTGFTVNYNYDLWGSGSSCSGNPWDDTPRLAGLTDGAGNPIVTYIYDAAGRLIEKDLGNGTYTTYQYDLAGNLLSLTNHGPRPAPGDDGTINSQFQYTYNRLGQRMSEANVGGVWTYQYDPAGQLTRSVFTSTNPALIPNQDELYVYDPAGNRTETMINGVTTAYVVNNLNEYTTVGTTNYSYDADGNLVAATDSSGTTTYSYNELNQLTASSSPTDTSSYQYDPLGHLASMTENGQVTQYVVDPAGLGSVVGAYSGSGGVVADYTYGLGLTSLVSGSGQTAYFDFDAHGSTVGLSGSTGAYLNQYAYDPFGQSVSSNVTTPNRFGYVGQFGVLTAGNGLMVMGTRDYSADLGRFTSIDLLGIDAGDPNLQRYVFNNPVSLIDPAGLDAIDDYLKCKKQEIHLTCSPGPNGPDDRLGAVKAECQALQERAALEEIKITNSDDVKKLKDKLDKAFKDEGKIPCDPPPGGGAPIPPGCSASTTTGKITCPPPGPGLLSHDPNAKTGPVGYGPQGFIPAISVFPYRVEFENDPTATAPAQLAIITDPLNPNIDWSTLQFTEVGFGSNVIALPAGTQHFQTTVPMDYSGVTFDVLIELSFNTSSGLITATFRSIDPATGLPPPVLIGFLPPEDGTGRGIGYVSYTVMPKPGLPTGTQIRNVASVIFDTNAPVTTDQVDDNDPSKGVDPAKQDLNTIDAVPPTSTVTPLPAFSPGSFTVNWSGQDDPGGSGINSFEVWVSDNGGPFTLWLDETTATSATFTGLDGHSYGFYSIAFDNAGNTQPIPAGAQATTEVDATPPTSMVTALPVTSPPSFTVSWSGSDNPGGSGLAYFSVYVSDNGSPFTLWQSATTETSAIYSGQRGHTYAFYSQATDNVGNLEAPHASADTQTTIVQSSDVAAISGPADGFSGVAGESLAYALSATDSDPSIQAQGFSYSVDWGDGKIDSFGPGAGSPTTASHVYMAPGMYTITLTATDAGGAVSAPVTTSADILPYEMQGTTLAIGGTTGNDAFIFSETTTPGTLAVTFNGKSIGQFKAGSVQVYDNGGSDSVTINGSTGSDAFVIDPGDVVLNGMTIAGDSVANWFANGREGNDTFTVNSGAHAILNGGTGASTLIGPDAANVWRISGTDRGNINSTVFFTNIENLVGGALDDRFRFTTGAGGARPLILGTIDGGAGTNTLDYSALTTDVTVNLATGTATGVGGTVTNIQNVTGGQGNDNLTGNGVDNVLIGGNGTNTLTAGSGNDILIGGAGINVLMGGAGRDLLIGGSGSDQLTAGSGDAILIGGSTSYDKNLAALEAILAEWARTDETYRQRVSHIHGFTTGGLNGAFFLTASTVHFGASPDTLSSGSGADWFWANLAIDTLINRKSWEREN
jgi:RHS repeat-associated protein